MSFIDKSYFIGEINVPGLQSSHVEDKLAVFISKYELEYLQRALGYSLWKAFTDGIALEAPEQKWIDLRDGKEFTNSRGFTEKWTGFVNEAKSSPIANYVYYFWSRDNVTFTTTMGEKKGKAENSFDVSASLKQSRAYNEMVKLTCKLREFLEANAVDYTEYDEGQVYNFGTTNIFNI